MKSNYSDLLNNVFIFYDFKQVKDMVMVVTFLDKENRWDKILVFSQGTHWDTLPLLNALTEEKYKWTCEKLASITNNSIKENDFIELDSEEIKKEFPFFSGLIDEFN